LTKKCCRGRRVGRRGGNSQPVRKEKSMSSGDDADYDLVTFGEAMVRLSPPHFARLEQARSLDVEVGGAEYNVAVAASRLGMSCAWVSRLPENPIGRMVRNRAREHGVDTSHIVWTKDGRVGLYFVESGAAPRASAVLYDRSHSAISQIRPDDVDWLSLLRRTRMFHVTGITPALSDSAAETTLTALKAAREAGCKVSYDLNYRAKLWSEEKARQIQKPMMEYVDIFVSTEEDTGRVFKISPGEKEQSGDFSTVSAETYKLVAKKLHEDFGFEVVLITLRENISVWRNNWTAVAYWQGEVLEDRKYEVEIVDRIGAGDSFVAGFLYGYLKEGSVERGLKIGNAFSALKHSVPGDLHWSSLEEVENLLRKGGLRISR